jgi:cellulose synthase/poly-beta-1,6-N-acetylglucosamine synthase-like glycosyltransferase
MQLLSLIVYVTAYFGIVISSIIFMTYFAHRKNLSDPIAKRFPFISFVIPVYNEEKVIGETIKSILEVNYPKNKYEIIVVDDGSTDNTYQEAKKLESSIVRVIRKENGGCASALNYGIIHARGELIARSDSDTLLSKDPLTKMIGYFEDKNVMAVTSSMNVKNHKGFVQKLQWSEYVLGMFLRKIFDLNNSLYVIPGPLSVFRKKFFDKYGGFDESCVTEDTEMAMRIQSHGYTIKNSLNASVYTIVPETFSSLIKQRIRWYTGFFHNSCDYKQLYDVRRKTNLSLFFLPAALLSIFLSFIAFAVFAYYNIRGIVKYIIKLGVTGISFEDMVRNFSFNRFLDLGLDYITSPYVFFLVFGILSALILILMSKYYSGEKRGLFFTCLIFFIVYPFFHVFTWAISFIYFITGIKQKWGSREYKRGVFIS